MPALTRILGPSIVPGGSLPLIPAEYFDHFVTGGQDGATSVGADGGKFSTTADAGEWLATITAGGAGECLLTIADGSDAGAPGGWLKILNDAADNDLVNLQLNGESFQITTTSKLIFEIKARITDVSETDWLWGLCSTDTSVLAGVNDGLYFDCLDSTGDIDAVCEDDTTEARTDTGYDVADATARVFRIEVDGVTEARFYIDNVLVHTQRSGLPDANTYLTPTISVRNDGAVAQSAYVDYIYVAQLIA